MRGFVARVWFVCGFGWVMCGPVMGGTTILSSSDGNSAWKVHVTSVTVAAGVANGTYTIGKGFGHDNAGGGNGGTNGTVTVSVSGGVATITSDTMIGIDATTYFAPDNDVVTESVGAVSGGQTAIMTGSVPRAVRQDCVSDGHGGWICPGACCGVTITDTMTIQLGGGCTSPVTVTGQWIGTRPVAGSAVINVEVGGLLEQITCTPGGCNSASIPGAQFALVNGTGAATVTYSVDRRSWDYGPDLVLHVPTVGSGSTGSVTCGGAVMFYLQGNIGNPSPTPAPSVTPTPTAGPTTTPGPSVTPVPTPAPNTTPTTVTNSTHSTNGTAGSGDITNEDFYNDVKQGVTDAGASMTPGTGGGDSVEPGHQSGDFTDRGRIDALASDAVEWQNSVTDGGQGVSGVLSGITGAISSLPSSFGSVSSVSVPLSLLNSMPHTGTFAFPSVIDLTGFSGMIALMRNVLLWLLRIAMFTASLRAFTWQN